MTSQGQSWDLSQKRDPTLTIRTQLPFTEHLLHTSSSLKTFQTHLILLKMPWDLRKQRLSTLPRAHCSHVTKPGFNRGPVAPKPGPSRSALLQAQPAPQGKHICVNGMFICLEMSVPLVETPYGNKPEKMN